MTLVTYVAGPHAYETAESLCLDTYRDAVSSDGGSCQDNTRAIYTASGQPGPDNRPLTWTGLPPTVAYVQMIDTGGHAFWQVPLDGIAAFPAPAGTQAQSLTGYDRSGTIVAQDGIDHPRPQTAPLVPDADQHPDWTLTLINTGTETLTTCLADHGVTRDGPTTDPLVMPAGTDIDTIWTNCITTTKTAILAKADSLRATPTP